MKLIRILAVLLAVSAAISFVSCGKNGNDEQTTPVTTEYAEPENFGPDTPITAEEEIDSLKSENENLNSYVINLWSRGFLFEDEDNDHKSLFNGTTVGDYMVGEIYENNCVTWKMSSPVILTSYLFYSGPVSSEERERNNGNTNPTAWLFMGSNDGANWENVDTVTQANMSTEKLSPSGYVIHVSHLKKFSYFKIVFTETPESGYLGLSEITLLGTVCEEDPVQTEAPEEKVPVKVVIPSGKIDVSTAGVPKDAGEWKTKKNSDGSTTYTLVTPREFNHKGFNIYKLGDVTGGFAVTIEGETKRTWPDGSQGIFGIFIAEEDLDGDGYIYESTDNYYCCFATGQIYKNEKAWATAIISTYAVAEGEKVKITLTYDGKGTFNYYYGGECYTFTDNNYLKGKGVCIFSKQNAGSTYTIYDFSAS